MTWIPRPQSRSRQFAALLNGDGAINASNVVMDDNSSVETKITNVVDTALADVYTKTEIDGKVNVINGSVSTVDGKVTTLDTNTYSHMPNTEIGRASC